MTPVTDKKQYVSRIVMGGKRLASSELATLEAAEPREERLRGAHKNGCAGPVPFGT